MTGAEDTGDMEDMLRLVIVTSLGAPSEPRRSARARGDWAGAPSEDCLFICLPGSRLLLLFTPELPLEAEMENAHYSHRVFLLF